MIEHASRYRYKVLKEMANRAIEARRVMRELAYLEGLEGYKAFRETLGDSFFQRMRSRTAFKRKVEIFGATDEEVFLATIAYLYVRERFCIPEALSRVQERLSKEDWTTFNELCMSRFYHYAFREAIEMVRMGIAEHLGEAEIVADREMATTNA